MNVGIGGDPIMAWRIRQLELAEARIKELEEELVERGRVIARYQRALHQAHLRISRLSLAQRRSTPPGAILVVKSDRTPGLLARVLGRAA